MKNIYVISQNTFLELVRNRVLYMFLFFAVFLLFLMLALGQLSFAEQFRLSISLGLASIHMCLVALTIFIGGSIVYKEIDRLTILTVLVRPLSRPQFLVGKYLGFLQLMFSFNLGFSRIRARSDDPTGGDVIFFDVQCFIFNDHFYNLLFYHRSLVGSAVANGYE